MEYRNKGRRGLKLGVISLGAWVIFGDQIDVEMAGISSIKLMKQELILYRQI